MPNKTKTLWSRLFALFGCTLAAFAFVVVFAPGASADTITGGAIADLSVDTNFADGTGAYTAISDLVLTADAIGDFVDGDTITITAPTDFAFEIDVNGVTATPANEVDLGGGAATAVNLTATASTITISVTTGNNATAVTAITVSSLAIRPTAAGAAPLESGSIAVVVTTGTFTDGDSSGSIVTVAGTFAGYGVATANAGTESVATPFTITVTPQDQYANTQATGASNSAMAITTNATTSPGGDYPKQDVAGANATWTTLTTAAMNLATGAKTTTETFRLVDSGETPTITVTESGATTCSGATVACVGTSSVVTVTVGAANKLMVATQASTTATIYQDFSTQPVVNVTDVYGNTVTGSSAALTTLTYSDAACSSAFTGTLNGSTATASSGVATFSGMDFGRKGTIYLDFSSTGITSACTGATAEIISPASASSIVVSASSSGSGDTTAPAAPTGISVSVNSSNQVVITWTDPTESDLATVEILRGIDPLPVDGTAYDAVAAGVETYTDTAVAVGDVATYILRSKDSSGNTSISDEYSITVEAGGTATTTTTTPTTTTTTTQTQTQTQTQTGATNRYGQAGVTESEVDSAVGAFSDLAKDAWHAPFITRMRNRAVLAGYPDGTVRPDTTINRAELAKIAAKAFGLSSAAETFSDVPASAWYAPFVGALQNIGAAWTTSSEYSPADGVTRGEAVWALLTAAGVDLDGVSFEGLFPDVGSQHRYAAAITFAAQNGIINGYDDGNFGPDDTLTRGQVAKIATLIGDL